MLWPVHKLHSPQPVTTEAALEAFLVRRVRSAGGECWKWVSPGHRGVPDRLCVLPGGRVVAVELKGPGGRVHSLQARAMKRLEELGMTVALIRTAEDIEELLRRMASPE